ncbi:hypothetical protein C162_18425 [Paenibacillus sp. FSL R7-269]|nr:hypothetical protein C162_18425 [Paenibacillus sp. FSL R7-269]
MYSCLKCKETISIKYRYDENQESYSAYVPSLCSKCKEIMTKSIAIREIFSDKAKVYFAIIKIVLTVTLIAIIAGFPFFTSVKMGETFYTGFILLYLGLISIASSIALT